MSERVATGGLDRLPRSRFLAFATLCLSAAVLLEDPLRLAGATPDFTVIVLVYGAIRWGALHGAVMGFGLGLFLDAIVLFHFGLHALGMTLIGYSLGKLRETLYLSTVGVDLLLLAGAKLALDVLILGVAAGGAWEAFELRFFWEAPLSALYTAAVGGLGYRLLLRT